MEPLEHLLGVKEHEGGQQGGRGVSPELLALPQHLLSHVAGQDIAKWSDSGLNVLQNFMQPLRKSNIIKIGENVINPSILKKILLNTQENIVQHIWVIGFTFSISSFPCHQTEPIIQLSHSRRDEIFLES